MRKQQTIQKTRFFNFIGDFSQHQSNSPENSLVGKFILIETPTEICLIYGLLEEYPYHAKLAERYCSEENIETGCWKVKPDEYEINRPDLTIKGGGWIEINSQASTMKFFGESKAYGPYDHADLVQVLSSEPFFGPFSITIA